MEGWNLAVQGSLKVDNIVCAAKDQHDMPTKHDMPGDPAFPEALGNGSDAQGNTYYVA